MGVLTLFGCLCVGVFEVVVLFTFSCSFSSSVNHRRFLVCFSCFHIRSLSLSLFVASFFFPFLFFVASLSSRWWWVRAALPLLSVSTGFSLSPLSLSFTPFSSVFDLLLSSCFPFFLFSGPPLLFSLPLLLCCSSAVPFIILT